MKKQKMNLANIQGKLSREEMKNVMAGSNEGGDQCYPWDVGSPFDICKLRGDGWSCYCFSHWPCQCSHP